MKRQFEVSGPVELDVRLPTGEIEVETTDNATHVELELIAHDEDSQQFVDEARLELREQQGTPHLVIDIPQRRGGFNFGSFFGRQGITLRVRAPHGSGLSVRTKSADVSVGGTLGSANIASASGDVLLERIEGDFLRRFTLPENARAEEITARHSNGVLEVVIPKQPVVVPRRVNIEVN